MSMRCSTGMRVIATRSASAARWPTNPRSFGFHGIAAHAAAAPERGRSALDGLESMDYTAKMVREHVPDSTRIPYVITKGRRGAQHGAGVCLGIFLRAQPQPADIAGGVGALGEGRAGRRYGHRHNG